MLGIKLDPGFVLHFLGVLPLKRKETKWERDRKFDFTLVFSVSLSTLLPTSTYQTKEMTLKTSYQES
jgi:hypothetical protein